MFRSFWPIIKLSYTRTPKKFIKLYYMSFNTRENQNCFVINIFVLDGCRIIC